MKKVLGFNSSPHVEGNTATLVKQILSGAEEQGAKIQYFNLNEMNIKGCQACMYCRDHAGRCAVDDDMRTILNEFDDADAFVLGSPLYMFQMNSQAKAFTDRLFALFVPGKTEILSNVKLILAYTQGAPDKETFKEYYEYNKKMFNFLGFTVIGDILGCGTGDNPVKKQYSLLTDAKKLGEKLV